ncbi:hypothetical protein [Paracoccus shanxieyensis]|uniref:Uncharacterized protein n=1 Tax=Paracoccus shanxieyensis TaxID=2675752 RepID=A0A6L6IYY0_9RHOB|nr:hypothetical protein [Paracoccus shanxieyensis]MTH64300.1 hypothetical protein [Paracoccus shanxieyensis]MTH87444.1 hypothetical protein [Paracoccus shanxieyensis]
MGYLSGGQGSGILAQKCKDILRQRDVPWLIACFSCWSIPAFFACCLQRVEKMTGGQLKKNRDDCYIM